MNRFYLDVKTEGLMEAGVKYFQHQYVKTRGIKYITKDLRVKKGGEGDQQRCLQHNP